MQKVKIAVIDTGADICDKYISNYIKFDRNIQIDASNTEYNIIKDVNGHGTLCIKTILCSCKNIQIYPIKVFDDNGKTSSWNMLEVLTKLLDSDIKIINISASTLNCPCIKELSYICKELYQKGKIIICSHHNARNAISSMPTKLKYVIGVKGINDIYSDTDYIYNPNSEIQMYANKKYKFLKFKDSITSFGKNSRAAAVASGIIADIINDNINISFEELENVLINKSVKDQNFKCGKLQKEDYNVDELKIAEEIVLLINKEFANTPVNLNLLKVNILFNNLTDIGKHNAYDFLSKINKAFRIHIEYQEIFLYELAYLNNLIDIIYKKIYNNA